MRRQCELLGLSRSAWYYEPASASAENLKLMRWIDEEYTRHPCMGRRRMTHWLQARGHAVNVKRVSRLMRVMGLAAIYPKPRLSRRCENHAVFPYLLRDVTVERVDQVWSTDITYVPMPKGFMYLAAVIDWHKVPLLPGVNAITSRTGLLGKFCASIGREKKIPSEKTNPL